MPSLFDLTKGQGHIDGIMIHSYSRFRPSIFLYGLRLMYIKFLYSLLALS